MDISVLGVEVTDELFKKCDEHFKCASYIRKGKNHETCDDAVLLLVNENFALIGVFDGVSGEPFAQSASETALRTIKFFITQNFGKMQNEKLVERAIEEANFAIDKGATTVSIVLVLPDGQYFFENIGDSHIYKLDEHGKVHRITKDFKGANGSGVIEYLHNRYLVGNCLGGLVREGEIEFGQGKLKKGEFLLAMSDGVTDNLFIEVEGGVISEGSGKHDLEILLDGKDMASEIIDAIAKVVKHRMRSGEMSGDGKILVPKEDDIGLVVFKF